MWSSSMWRAIATSACWALHHSSSQKQTDGSGLRTSRSWTSCAPPGWPATLPQTRYAGPLSLRPVKSRQRRARLAPRWFAPPSPGSSRPSSSGASRYPSLWTTIRRCAVGRRNRTKRGSRIWREPPGECGPGYRSRANVCSVHFSSGATSHQEAWQQTGFSASGPGPSALIAGCRSATLLSAIVLNACDGTHRSCGPDRERVSARLPRCR